MKPSFNEFLHEYVTMSETKLNIYSIAFFQKRILKSFKLQEKVLEKIYICNYCESEQVPETEIIYHMSEHYHEEHK